MVPLSDFLRTDWDGLEKQAGRGAADSRIRSGTRRAGSKMRDCSTRQDRVRGWHPILRELVAPGWTAFGFGAAEIIGGWVAYGTAGQGSSTSDDDAARPRIRNFQIGVGTRQIGFATQLAF